MNGLKINRLKPPLENPANWRAYTPARVGLGRTGSSIATRDLLDFNLAHAAARDAVHAALNVPAMLAGLRQRGLDALALHSAAADRPVYLRRPDLGRRLDPDSCAVLRMAAPANSTGRSLVIVIADGLSAIAVENHALFLLDTLLPLLGGGQMPSIPRSIHPIAVVEQARVAIADEVGAILNSDLSLLLIGERPGLSSPDSLGAYLTWNPRPGRTDAERNCVSNIRREGLSYDLAAQSIAYYLNEASRRQLTGTALKSGGSLLPGAR